VVVVPRWFSVEPGVSLNWVRLPYGRFNAPLITSRLVVTPSPRMLLSSLIQYNGSAHTLTSSMRLRWEYTPGSTFYLVWTQARYGDSGIYDQRFGERFGDTFALPMENVLMAKVSYLLPL
jgi:hypothetical protein